MKEVNAVGSDFPIDNVFSRVSDLLNLQRSNRRLRRPIVSGLPPKDGASDVKESRVVRRKIETFASVLIPGGTAYKDVFSFLVVIFFLVFKPSGILGEKVYEKV